MPCVSSFEGTNDPTIHRRMVFLLISQCTFKIIKECVLTFLFMAKNAMFYQDLTVFD